VDEKLAEDRSDAFSAASLADGEIFHVLDYILAIIRGDEHACQTSSSSSSGTEGQHEDAIDAGLDQIDER